MVALREERAKKLTMIGSAIENKHVPMSRIRFARYFPRVDSGHLGGLDHPVILPPLTADESGSLLALTHFA